MPDDKTKRVPSIHFRRHLAKHNLEGVSYRRLESSLFALKEYSDQIMKHCGPEAHAKVVAALRELVTVDGEL